MLEQSDEIIRTDSTCSRWALLIEDCDDPYVLPVPDVVPVPVVPEDVPAVDEPELLELESRRPVTSIL